ncbi:MAG: zf-HC2 domain-containing protein [Longimicrobiales bacterium]
MSLLDRMKAALGFGEDTEAKIQMMSCRDVGERLFDYIDGELDLETIARVRAHVEAGECECERALLLEIAFHKKVKGCLDSAAAPDGLRQRVLDSLSG